MRNDFPEKIQIVLNLVDFPVGRRRSNEDEYRGWPCIGLKEFEFMDMINHKKFNQQISR